MVYYHLILTYGSTPTSLPLLCCVVLSCTITHDIISCYGRGNWIGLKAHIAGTQGRVECRVLGCMVHLGKIWKAKAGGSCFHRYT